MDARERLRQFLEQRREIGESEFVLDNMSVEEAMALLGAGRGPAGTRESPLRGRRGAADDAPAVSTGGASGNWRDALRAIDAPVTGEPTRATPMADDSRRRDQVRSDVERAPAPTRDAPFPAAALGEPDLDVGATSHELVSASPMIDDTFPRPDAGSSRGAPTREPSPEPEVPLSSIPSGLVVGSSAHELFSGPGSPFKSLDDVHNAIASCTRCSLYKTAKNAVPGEGRADADLMCVGEAPGATEDETGRPFVGQAGTLLTKILAAINLPREDVFIVNVLKHRPPANRNPLPDEVTACSPYLVRQIELIRPKVIIAFGTFAAQTLLQTKESLGKLRGKIHRYYGVPLIVTYHPAALLRNPSWKRPTWEDVKLARRLLDRATGA